MGDLFPLILFATIAVLFAVRLYLVLGKRSDDDGAPAPGSASPALAHTGPRPAFTGPAAAGMEDIRAADGVFDPDEFLEGARQAYAMVGEAFARGDRDTLKSLLSDTVFTKWNEAIDAREEAGNTQLFELSRLSSAEIDEAGLRDGLASVTVRFAADLSTAVRNRDGEVIDGDPARIQRVDEIWTFQRNVASSNPNWLLSKVRKG